MNTGSSGQSDNYEGKHRKAGERTFSTAPATRLEIDISDLMKKEKLEMNALLRDIENLPETL